MSKATVIGAGLAGVEAAWQLAKAGIAAGIRILAETYGLDGIEQIDRVVLAGGFGYYLKAEDGAGIGLLPAQLIPKVISGGNTVLAGIRKFVVADWASTYLKEATREEMTWEEAITEEAVSEEPDSQIEKIVTMTKVINLAEQDGFQDTYIESMNLKRW